jgi:chemotaxis-related protein WspB
MKVLVFHIGPDRYGLRLTQIARVLPVVALKQVPLSPPWVAGLMDLHGEPVPVIDLSHLAGFIPEQIWFDTRIILVDYALPGGGTASLGLQAEHVAGVESIDGAALREPGLAGASFLGQVAGGSGGMLQLVELSELLAPDVCELLFPTREIQ